MLLETQTYRVFLQCPRIRTLARVCRLLCLGRGRRGGRGAAGTGCAKTARSPRARGGLVGRDRSGRDRPGTLPRQTPDRHGCGWTRKAAEEGRARRPPPRSHHSARASPAPAPPRPPAPGPRPSRRRAGASLGCAAAPHLRSAARVSTSCRLTGGSTSPRDRASWAPPRAWGRGGGCPGCRMKPKIHPL